MDSPSDDSRLTALGWLGVGGWTMAFNIRTWNLSGSLVLAACGSPGIPVEQDPGNEAPTSSTGSPASSESESESQSETGTPPECVDANDCPPEWGCYDGVCEYAACPTDGGGCGDDGDGPCGSDEDCDEFEYCSDAQCISGDVIPTCAEVLEITPLPIPIDDGVHVDLVSRVDAHAILVFSGAGGLGVATAQGPGTIFETPEVGEPHYVIASEDFDGDEVEDIAVRGVDGSGVTVVVTYAVDEAGITALGTTPIEAFVLVADSDIDGDGHIDLGLWEDVVGTYVMRGLGDGTFSPAEPLAFSDYFVGGVQLDDDGRAELVTDRRHVWSFADDPQLTQSFEAQTNYPMLELSGAVAIDLDVDGTRELIMESGSSPTVIEHVDANGNLMASFLAADASSLVSTANIMGRGQRDLVMQNGIIAGLPDVPCWIYLAPAISVTSGNFVGDERDEVVYADDFTNEIYLVSYTGS